MFRRCKRWLATPSVEDVLAAYKVLKLPAGAPQSVVRGTYLELARRHHPDLSSGDDSTMKVINTAYELIQTHGSLVRSQSTPSSENETSSSPHSGAAGSSTSAAGSRFKKRVPRRSRVLADLGEGDSWATKTDLDWTVAMRDIPEKDLLNPANHPYSVSKHYSFEDDATIYRMIRTGATPREVGRTLGKPATFIEKRINNAQFKQRVQILLRKEKESRPMRQQVDMAAQMTIPNARKHWNDMSYEERHAFMGVHPTTSSTTSSSVRQDKSSSFSSRVGGGGGGQHSLQHSQQEGSYDTSSNHTNRGGHQTSSSSSSGGGMIGFKLGRNYANFERFHRSSKSGGGSGSSRAWNN